MMHGHNNIKLWLVLSAQNFAWLFSDVKENKIKKKQSSSVYDCTVEDVE